MLFKITLHYWILNIALFISDLKFDILEDQIDMRASDFLFKNTKVKEYS